MGGPPGSGGGLAPPGSGGMGPASGVLAAYKQHRGSVDHENVFFPKGFSSEVYHSTAEKLREEKIRRNSRGHLQQHLPKSPRKCSFRSQGSQGTLGRRS